MQFNLAVTTAQGPYNFPFSIRASIPQPPASAFFDNFENGVNGWTTGGAGNAWAQTTAQSHSPTHSWTDSPAGSYADNVDSWLQSPVINLTGKTDVGVSGFFKYALEAGFDYAYLEYSTDGGTTYNATPLATFNGVEANWVQTSVSAAALDNQANARLRLRFAERFWRGARRHLRRRLQRDSISRSSASHRMPRSSEPGCRWCFGRSVIGG